MNDTTECVSGFRKSTLLGISVFALGLGLAFPTLAGTVALSFATQQTFATGRGPRSVIAVDVNTDGKPDLITANAGDNTVSVLFNTTPAGASASSFGQQTFDTGSEPLSVAAADINGDGKPDLIIANTFDNTVSVLINTTEPGATITSFAGQQAFDTGTFPVSVTAADVNGDGSPDLIVTNDEDNTVSVLLNTTEPGATIADFAVQQTFATGGRPFAAAAADINGDGRPDLIVTNGQHDPMCGCDDGTISVLLNITTPSAITPDFSAQQIFVAGAGPASITAVDLNGDGKPDLVVGNSYVLGASVLINTTIPGAATSSFAAQQVIATGPFNAPSVGVADVNNDGLADLVIAATNVLVRLNTTAPEASIPSFGAVQTFSTATYPDSITAADLNGDGKPDLITADSMGVTVSVLLNTTPLPGFIFADGFD